MDKIVGLIIVVSLLIFGIYFFHIGKFRSKSFIPFMSIVLFSGLAFYVSDRLKEFDLKNLKLVLSELKETRKDIEKEVNLLMETLAENYVYSATETGRLIGGDNINKDMIVKRERARVLLRKAGWDETKINTELEKINRLIASDHANKILNSAWNILREKEPEKAGSISKEFHEGFRAIKNKGIDKETVKELKSYLEKYEVPLDNLQFHFEALNYFIANKELIPKD